MKTAKYDFLNPVHIVCAVVVYLAVFNPSHLHGQTLNDFREIQLSKIDTSLLSLETPKGLQYLSLAPSISYSVNTGVNVGVSLSNISNFIQQKQRNKIEKAKLETQLLEKLNNEILKAREIEIEILNSFEKVSFELSILKEQFQLFQLNQEKFESQEITFSEFTQSKISYMKNWLSVIDQINKIELQNISFFNTYNFNPVTTSLILKTARTYEPK